MRRIFFAIICTLLFFAACSPLGVQANVQQLESVKLFKAMHDGDVTVTKTKFTGSLARDIKDLVEQECFLEDDAFVRTIFEGKGANLVVYSDVKGKETHCVIFKPEESPQIMYFSVSDAPEEGIALTVNGESITTTEVQEALSVLPENIPRDQAVLKQVLNRMANDELLRQEASSVEVSQAEIVVAGSLETAQLNKLVQERLLTGEIQISEEQLQELYLQNTNQFVQSEQAVMRQIFLSNAERTPEQVQELAREVVSELQNGEDFCALVLQYSDDLTSRDTCGTYVLPRGIVDPNLEYASFNTPPEQTVPVHTADGIHLVQSLQTVPAQVLSYGGAVKSLRSSAVNAEFQQRLNMYLVILRSDAEIKVFLN